MHNFLNGIKGSLYVNNLFDGQSGTFIEVGSYANRPHNQTNNEHSY